MVSVAKWSKASDCESENQEFESLRSPQLMYISEIEKEQERRLNSMELTLEEAKALLDIPDEEIYAPDQRGWFNVITRQGSPIFHLLNIRGICIVFPIRYCIKEMSHANHDLFGITGFIKKAADGIHSVKYFKLELIKAIENKWSDSKKIS